MEATVFNMQKFSLNDGPGIRTVVFLKGCPLRCPWCSNPESQRRAPEPMADPNAGGEPAMQGQTRSVDEVMDFCLQDLPFYEQSGGGVTLSGGEALMWPDFCVELLSRCHEQGIDTCMETTAFAKPATFDRVAEHLDHILLDMKHWDSMRHLEVVGVPNEPILDNTARAIAAGVDVLPRIPVIPGFNETLDDAKGFCDRLGQVGATRAQLLPFHQFGESKYDRLGREYAYADVDALHPEDLTDYLQVFIDNGIDAFI